MSEDKPADCASQGIFPSELLAHNLWWNGPSWLKLQPSKWPKNDSQANMIQEGKELNNITCTVTVIEDSVIPVDKLPSFNQYKRVTAWIIRFLHNCKARIRVTQPKSGTEELNRAANYWYSVIQRTHFPDELRILNKGSQKISTSNKLYSLNPFVDNQGVMRVDGRQQKARLFHNSRHPIILESWHTLTKLLIQSEHTSLLHGGSLLVSSSLFHNIHIVGGHRAIRSIVRTCVTCRRRTPKAKPHLKGVVRNSKLDFEEMTTILTQIEACLNSRPVHTVPRNDDDGIEMLTPEHFLIGRPLQAIPDHSHSSQSPGCLRRWYLCQSFVRHFWERWRNEYIIALQKHSKWKCPNDNFQVGDVVIKEDNLISMHWPITLIIETNAGTDGLIHVVTLKTKDRTYKLPV